ncbi:hypothetical protein [Halocynthiibacter sp.]|uniref:hypothetical protein n=1 Tax=Halocynthiibacter sp. TaxID=1979210 RepID=UPI003C343972
MKVMHNHPDRLVLFHHPVGLFVFIAMFLIGFAFAGVFLGVNGIYYGWSLVLLGLVVPSLILARMTLRTDVIFDRATERMNIDRKRVWGVQRNGYDLREILQASIEVTHFGKNHSETFRCQLDTANGTAIFLTTELYELRQRPQKTVDTINTWLRLT